MCTSAIVEEVKGLMTQREMLVQKIMDSNVEYKAYDKRKQVLGELITSIDKRLETLNAPVPVEEMMSFTLE